MQVFFQRTFDWALTSGAHVLLVLALALVALILAKRLSKRLIQFVIRQKEDAEFQKRTQTLGVISQYIMDHVIITVAAIARTMTLPVKQWRAGREFNRRLKKKFDELNIEIPFHHVTLYIGQNKQGQSNPLCILKEEGMPTTSQEEGE